MEFRLRVNWLVLFSWRLSSYPKATVTPACCCITPDFLADSRLPFHVAPATATFNAKLFASRVYLQRGALLDVP